MPPLDINRFRQILPTHSSVNQKPLQGVVQLPKQRLQQSSGKLTETFEVYTAGEAGAVEGEEVADLGQEFFVISHHGVLRDCRNVSLLTFISEVPESCSRLGNDLTGTAKAQHVMKMMISMTMIKLTLLLPAMKLRANQNQTRRDGEPGRRLILAVKRIVKMRHLAVSCISDTLFLHSQNSSSYYEQVLVIFIVLTTKI